MKSDHYITAHPTIPEFDYVKPTTLAEASQVLIDNAGEARPLLGGTDIFVRMRDGVWEDKYLVDVKALDGLDDIAFDPSNGLTIGAAVNMNRVSADPQVGEYYPVLVEAIESVASYQLRSRATIVGNICNASPAAETAPALITMGATARIVGKDGERTIPVEDLFTGPSQTVIKNGELLTEIQIPNQPPNSTGVYLKHGKRLSDIAIVGAGISLTMDDGVCKDVKIALASAAPTPTRVKKAEKLMKGQKVNDELLEEVARVAMEESKPIDDLRAYADYRKEKVGVLVKEALKQGMQQIRLGGC